MYRTSCLLFEKNKVRRIKYYKIHRVIALTAFFSFMAGNNILIKYYVELAINMGLIGMWYYVIPINNYQKIFHIKEI